MSNDSKNQAPNSPPFKGGVPEGRGGCSSDKHPEKLRINNLPHLKQYRKKLRNKSTPAEATLWSYIRDKKIEGRKFRRQHSIGNFILDFYCPSEKLAIELDGNAHFDNFIRDDDIDRTVYLSEFGVRVLRFENKMIFEEMAWVLGFIKNNFGWNIQPPRP